MNRLLATSALAAFIAAIAIIAWASRGSGDGGSKATTTAATTGRAVRTKPAATSPKPLARIRLGPVAAYDPEGDHRENDSDVPNAVDGNPATFWSTEHYTNGFFKKGVGIVLDAGRRQAIGRVLVGTDQAGSRAEIQLGDKPTGPFRVVSADQTLDRSTTFSLTPGARGRYLLVWITAMPPAVGEAHVTEVRALAR